MADTFTLTLSGTSSILEAHYFPPIELSSSKTYVLGLIELLTFNSIPNVDESNNKLHIIESKTIVGSTESSELYFNELKRIVIPTGSYEIEDIDKYLQSVLKTFGVSLKIKPNNNTLQSEVVCDHDLDLRPVDSIGRLLGFAPKVLRANKTHLSDLPVTILKVNALRVECNITSGAYLNGHKAHTIHEFFPLVPPGYKIVEVPSHVIYLPITAKIIDHIHLRIVDQDGELVNFRNEVITIRLHVKSM